MICKLSATAVQLYEGFIQYKANYFTKRKRAILDKDHENPFNHVNQGSDKLQVLQACHGSKPWHAFASCRFRQTMPAIPPSKRSL